MKKSTLGTSYDSKMKVEQKITGNGNSIALNVFVAKCNSHEDVTIDLDDLIMSITMAFEKEDDAINALLPDKLINTKNNTPSEFKSSKIITSLLQLGIPLPAVFSITQIIIDKVKKQVSTSDCVQLSTKEIREIVSKSIQEVDIKDYSYSDIESWNNRYIRRYGHNNCMIQIYNCPDNATAELSYDFINNILIDDIVRCITKGTMLNFCDGTNTKQKREVATEIMNFISSCDLYKIDYNVLKMIIMEIALQPPHPWFVTDETRKDIIAYDKRSLTHNLEKASNDITEMSQPVKMEIIHHAASLILECHNYFLGCYDLSSFNILKELLATLTDKEKWDMAIDNYAIGQLLSDFSFSNVSPQAVIKEMNTISLGLTNKKVDTDEFRTAVCRFGEYAVRLYELGEKSGVEKFLKEEWKYVTFNDIIKYIKLMLYSIYPVKKWNTDANERYFWVNYNVAKLDITPYARNQVLVIFDDGEDLDYQFLKLLEEANNKMLCNTIIVVSEDEIIATRAKQKVLEFLNNNNLISHYTVSYLDKRMLNELFESSAKGEELCKLIEEQLSLT